MRSRGTVGLDIGTSAARAAELGHARSGPVLRRFGQVALPPGAVRDGEVVDVDAVAQALRQLWQWTGFTAKRVVLGVASPRVVVRQVDLPWMPDDELRTSLPLQVQDVLPMPVENALLDFHRLEELTDEEGRRVVRILLVAAPRDMVASMLAAVTRVGLRPVGVDLTAFAVLRALAWVDRPVLPEARTEALLDVGARTTNLVVHQSGVPRFVRILPFGGADVTDAVADRLGVPLDQAEAVKLATALPAPGAAGTATESRVMDQISDAFVDEVRGSLEYYASRPGAARVERLLLTGGGGLLDGLADRLAASTRLPVLPGAVFAHLATGGTGLTADQLRQAEPVAAVPVGLALGVAS